MEQHEIKQMCDKTESNSTSNSSFANDSLDQRRMSDAASTKNDRNHSSNHKASNNYTNKDRFWNRPSMTPSDDGSQTRKQSKQDKEVSFMGNYSNYLKKMFSLSLLVHSLLGA